MYLFNESIQFFSLFSLQNEDGSHMVQLNETFVKRRNSMPTTATVEPEIKLYNFWMKTKRTNLLHKFVDKCRRFKKKTVKPAFQDQEKDKPFTFS